MFYKHAAWKNWRGQNPEQAIRIAETISGDESVANAVAFAMVVETIRKTEIPSVPGRYARSAGNGADILSPGRHGRDDRGCGIPKGASHFFILREEFSG